MEPIVVYMPGPLFLEKAGRGVESVLAGMKSFSLISL